MFRLIECDVFRAIAIWKLVFDFILLWRKICGIYVETVIKVYFSSTVACYGLYTTMLYICYGYVFALLLLPLSWVENLVQHFVPNLIIFRKGAVFLNSCYPFNAWFLSMVRHTLKVLQQILQDFQSVCDHFGTLCILGSIMHTKRLPFHPLLWV